MGQRHQIYAKMPKELGIAGFHHQWLYGMNAVKSLARVVKFYENQSEYGPLKDTTGYGLLRQSKVIESLYSTDPETGYWHHISNFLEEYGDEPSSEILDPRNGDNNDGITILDFSKGDLRYCFMNICHLEGEVRDVPKLKPLSAREYLLSYYPEFFNKLGRVDWQLKEQTGEVKRYQIDDEEFDQGLHALLSIEKTAKLLTLAECKKLFPAMYPTKIKAVK